MDMLAGRQFLQFTSSPCLMLSVIATQSEPSYAAQHPTVTEVASPLVFKPPNEVAQEALIKRAYKVVCITEFSKTAFIECRGTGTLTGGRIEAKAVGRVFGPASGVYMGSVKPNPGHSGDTSARLISLIKAVIGLKNRIIPPNIKFNKPNPSMPWRQYGLSVPIEPMD